LEYSIFLSFTESFSASAAVRSVVDMCAAAAANSIGAGFWAGRPCWSGPAEIWASTRCTTRSAVAANRAGEMGVVGLGQAVMAQGVHIVGRPFQALEKPEFERVFFRLAADGGQEFLHFAPVGEIPGLAAMAQRELAELRQLVGIGFSWIR